MASVSSLASGRDAGVLSKLTDMCGQATTTGKRDILRTWKDRVVGHWQLGGIKERGRGNKGNQSGAKMIMI